MLSIRSIPKGSAYYAKIGGAGGVQVSSMIWYPGQSSAERRHAFHIPCSIHARHAYLPVLERVLRREAPRRSRAGCPLRNQGPFGERDSHNSWWQARRHVPYTRFVVRSGTGHKHEFNLMQATILRRSSSVAAASRHLCTAQLPKLSINQLNKVKVESETIKGTDVTSSQSLVHKLHRQSCAAPRYRQP